MNKKRRVKQIEVLFSEKIIDELLEGDYRLDKQTIEFLNHLKKDKRRYEKINPISNRFVRSIRLLG